MVLPVAGFHVPKGEISPSLLPYIAKIALFFSPLPSTGHALWKAATYNIEYAISHATFESTTWRGQRRLASSPSTLPFATCSCKYANHFPVDEYPTLPVSRPSGWVTDRKPAKWAAWLRSSEYTANRRSGKWAPRLKSSRHVTDRWRNSFDGPWREPNQKF